MNFNTTPNRLYKATHFHISQFENKHNPSVHTIKCMKMEYLPLHNKNSTNVISLILHGHGNTVPYKVQGITVFMTRVHVDVCMVMLPK